MAAELTVGLITHDDPAGLIQSAACVFNQSWQGDIALCIVNAGITDEMLQVVERLEEGYGTVRVMRELRHASSAHSRNQVIRSADSKYLAWIDVGDLWHPRKLELQFQAYCLIEIESFPALLIQ